MSRRKECAKVIFKNLLSLVCLAGFPLTALLAMKSGKYPDIGWLEVVAVAYCSLGLFQMSHLSFPEKHEEMISKNKETDSLERMIYKSSGQCLKL